MRVRVCVCAAVQVGDWKQSRGLKVREDGGGGKKKKKVILNFCGSYASRMCTDSVSSQEISFMFRADVLIITVKLFWPWTDTSKALGVGLFMVPLATFSWKITQHFIPKFLI